MEPAKIVAEIGCNHKGEMEIAREMIAVAATFAKVDYVKFQKRNNVELLTEEQYNAPHPNPVHSYSDTYGEHRELLEFTVDQHRQLKARAEEFGIGYCTSVWDVTSAREMAELEPDFLKVPSASNLHFEMLDVLCDEFGGDIHVSLGMTTRAEEDRVVDLFSKKGRAKDVVLYACTSGYPIPFEDACILEVPRIREKFGSTVKDIGFSGHHNGISLDVAVFTLGAAWIERHFTLDRTWKGTDHAASLEPDGMRRVARDVKNVALALTEKPTDILEIENPQRQKLKWNPDPGSLDRSGTKG